MAELPIVRTIAGLREQVRAWRAGGLSVGFVPTMGALHEGHLALIRQARGLADRTVCSIFVNPTQFAPTEDLDRYPRQEARDAELLATEGCDLLFAPTPAEMYPPGFATRIQVAGPTDGLESDSRPHFFGGVALVVAKLLNQVQADVAVFGEKDYQQLLTVRRMARDLDIPTQIVGGSTVRDAHGLALSSRNAYLNDAELSVARRLNVILKQAGLAALSGAPVGQAEAQAAEALLAAGFDRVDYVALRRAEDLGIFPGDRLGAPARILAAAWLGGTRLIDNMAVE
ncbi:pantoate--beta-alanine ligase [Brevundimonas sp. 2R-24]|uniref:Pantothenate synthetase n=1 Tax=Peiella sedimenti TaxID=3061083 RepID=A0ABT8SIZ9_9CAUL|nr:pantoate--beta-alanine ligase [Caulobacteraceae bacterium XZ-24]